MTDGDFRAVFFEEAAEHLQAIENELLTLDADPGDEEALNGVFRAAHSIKGSAGMFGFNELSAFTHHLETLLDLIRKGQAELTDDRVELTLQAADEIRAMVDQLADSGEEAPADPELTRALEQAVAEVVPTEKAGSDGSAASGADDGSFGLFDDEVTATAPEDDSFGLFDPEPDPAGAEAAADDEGFGLFEGTSGEASPAAGEGGHSAYRDYFDQMFGGDDTPQTPAGDSEPELASAAGAAGETGARKIEEPVDQPVNEAIDEPIEKDGRFGWLNRPEGRAAKPATAPAPEAPARPTPARWGSGAAGGTSMRVSLEKVDELVNQISELVITQAMLQETGKELDPVANERHLATLETLERNTRELQESVLSIRLMPVSFLYSRFPRVVRDLARKLGKQVELIQLGEQTELDKSLIEKLADPLTHLVRNSIDHGVEMPEQRLAAGKPEKGQVVMTAEHEGGNIVIAISDDGAGMDRDRILAKARSNGLDVSDDWTDEAVFNLIFEPGFSTAAEVTDISGRGVGMDVVRRNIRELGGTVDVDSRLGEGSRFTVRLPLTLAITDGMVVRVGRERYVLPLATVVESLPLTPDDIQEVQGKARVIHRHGDYLKLLDLAAALDPEVAQDRQQDNLAVVVESEGRQVALLVDELVGQQQVVIKNLESNYRKVAGFSGATVMGDGAVAFILDVSHFVARSDSGREMPVVPQTDQIPD